MLQKIQHQQNRELNMSFIFNDQELINELIKLAQVTQPVPAASPAPTDEDQIKNIAKKLVDNLTAQLNTPAEPFAAEKGDAALTTKHLTNLSNLLNFLENSGISADGHKLVIKHAQQAFSSGVSGDAEFKQLAPSAQAMYAKYPDDEDNFQYYVYKAGLLKYMRDLRQKSEGSTPGARVLRPYVERLVQQVNDELEIDANAPTEEQGQGAQKDQEQRGVQPGQKDQQGQGKSNVPWHPGQQLSAQQIKSLQAISMRYPFQSDRIDFQYIDQWLTSYMQVMQNFPGINIGQDAQYAQQYVKSIMMTFGMTQQPLTNTAENIYRIMKSNAEAKAVEPNAAIAYPATYLQYVYKLVVYLQNALLNFKSIFYPSFPQDWKEDLDNQVDNSASSLAAHTLEVVQQWVNELPSAQKRVEGR